MTKRILAFVLTFVMLLAFVPFAAFSVSAIDGAGAPTDMNFYTFGVDISEWNGEVIDYAKLKASGCDYVILRVGYETTIDELFLQNYQKAREAGMPMGAYLYSHATTYSGAAAEAEFCIDIFEKNNMFFEYPIYIDIEREDQLNLSTADTVSLCEGWCETLVNAGYFPGVYALLDVMYDLKKDADFVNQYDLWVPHVGSVTADGEHYNYKSKAYNEDGYSMWQYSWFNVDVNGNYIYDGVYNYGTVKTKNLDLDVCYKDYPSIMYKYGWNNCDSSNLALGKSYTTTTPNRNDGWDDDNTRLTDGKKGSLEGETYVYSGWNSKSIDITVDLGSDAEQHNTYTLYTAKNSGWGIEIPTDIRISVSNDGNSFSPLCSSADVVDVDAEGEWSTHTITAQGVTNNYRYVRFTVVTNCSHIWVDEVAITYDENATPSDNANLAYQKTYTASGIYSDENGNVVYPDENNVTMTDGFVANEATDYADVAFAGFNRGTEFYETNGYASILVDLEKSYWMNEFSAYVSSSFNLSVGIKAPEAIEVYVSEDKVNWKKAGDMIIADSETVNCVKATLTRDYSVSGRYIDYRFVGAVNWIMIAEVEAFEGEAHNHVPGEWKIVTEAEEGKEGLKEQSCSQCGDLLDSEVIPALKPKYALGDVNADSKIDSIDYLLVKRHCFGTYALSDDEYVRANVNKDGTVDSLDYILIKRIVFGTYTVQ